MTSLDSIRALSKQLSPEFLEEQRLLPLRMDDEVVHLGTWGDSVDHDGVYQLEQLFGRRAALERVDANEARHAVRRLYGTSSAQSLIDAMHDDASVTDASDQPAIDDLRALANEAPVIRLVSLLLTEALDARASDVHLEAYPDGLRIRTRIDGREHLPRGQAVVFCSNHQSNVDPPILFQVLHPRLHVLFKRELTKLPLLGRVFQIGGFVPIDRSSREHSMAAIERAAASLRSGNSFLTFPEGTRSRTGDLLPFKRGPFLMALKAQVPVVPVAIQGGTASMRKGSWIVRPTTVSVRIGAPVETRGLDLSDREQLADTVRARVEALLAQGPVA